MSIILNPDVPRALAGLTAEQPTLEQSAAMAYMLWWIENQMKLHEQSDAAYEGRYARALMQAPAHCCGLFSGNGTTPKSKRIVNNLEQALSGDPVVVQEERDFLRIGLSAWATNLGQLP